MEAAPRTNCMNIYVTPQERQAIEAAREACRERIGDSEAGAAATKSMSAFIKYAALGYTESIELRSQASMVAHYALTTLAMKCAAVEGFDFRELNEATQKHYLAMAVSAAEAVGQGKSPGTAIGAAGMVGLDADDAPGATRWH